MLKIPNIQNFREWNIFFGAGDTIFLSDEDDFFIIREEREER